MAPMCFDLLIGLLINDVQKVQASQGSKRELCVRVADIAVCYKCGRILYWSRCTHC